MKKTVLSVLIAGAIIVIALMTVNKATARIVPTPDVVTDTIKKNGTLTNASKVRLLHAGDTLLTPVPIGTVMHRLGIAHEDDTVFLRGIEGETIASFTDRKASESEYGVVKVDGTSITATDGVISAAGGGLTQTINVINNSADNNHIDIEDGFDLTSDAQDITMTTAVGGVSIFSKSQLNMTSDDEVYVGSHGQATLVSHNGDVQVNSVGGSTTVDGKDGVYIASSLGGINVESKDVVIYAYEDAELMGESNVAITTDEGDITINSAAGTIELGAGNGIQVSGPTVINSNLTVNGTFTGGGAYTYIQAYPDGSFVDIVAEDGSLFMYGNSLNMEVPDIHMPIGSKIRRETAATGVYDTYITNSDYASTSTAGVVKVDGSSITVNNNGVISATGGGGGYLPITGGTLTGDLTILAPSSLDVQGDITGKVILASNSITSPGYHVDGKTNDDVLLAGGGTAAKNAHTHTKDQITDFPAWSAAATKPTYTASDVGAVPTSRTVNSKALSANISLTASDVGAVPTSRTVNSKALSANVTLTAADVGAAAIRTDVTGNFGSIPQPDGNYLIHGSSSSVEIPDAPFSSSRWFLTTMGDGTKRTQIISPVDYTTLWLRNVYMTDTGGITAKSPWFQIATMNMVYPVGSIYMSVNNVNPGTYILNTTWVAWGAGRVPVAVDTTTDFNTVEKTGGAKTVILTVAQMPEHHHKKFSGYANPSTEYGDTRYLSRVGGGATLTDLYTEYAGSNEAHTNLQPYITCYMWKRTQ
ncbi:hypothetical protein EZS27_016174 [termite gut metagenome]|uniref:Baseplate structural protein Gp10 C-terminal domain-containing protein n=1 Tax=termite gut metagenome TaxID=433724 RepID=A0A5J4RNY5_9ZZZZ